MSPSDRTSCFACGELNTPDSRFCKFCGRSLLPQERPPGVAQDPRNRLMLWLVIILIVACMVFGIFGLVTSKVLRSQPSAMTMAAPAITNWL